MASYRYARNTAVSVASSKHEIERFLLKAGANGIVMGSKGERAVVAFEVSKWRLQFDLRLPSLTDRRFTHTEARGSLRSAETASRLWEDSCRESWRALALSIKAKLVSVEAGVEVFEEAFLAQIIVPGRGRFAETALPALEAAYETGSLPPLLPEARR